MKPDVWLWKWSQFSEPHFPKTEVIEHRPYDRIFIIVNDTSPQNAKIAHVNVIPLESKGLGSLQVVGCQRHLVSPHFWKALAIWERELSGCSYQLTQTSAAWIFSTTPGSWVILSQDIRIKMTQTPSLYMVGCQPAPSSPIRVWGEGRHHNSPSGPHTLDYPRFLSLTVDSFFCSH